MSQNEGIKVEKFKLMSKSMPIGVILTLLFGGLGVFYTSITAGIVCTIIEGILVFAAFVTLGLGGILIPVAHVIFVIYTIAKINSHNRKLMEQVA